MTTRVTWITNLGIIIFFTIKDKLRSVSNLEDLGPRLKACQNANLILWRSFFIIYSLYFCLLTLFHSFWTSVYLLTFAMADFFDWSTENKEIITRTVDNNKAQLQESITNKLLILPVFKMFRKLNDAFKIRPTSELY